MDWFSYQSLSVSGEDKVTSFKTLMMSLGWRLSFLVDMNMKVESSWEMMRKIVMLKTGFENMIFFSCCMKLRASIICDDV